MKTEDYNVEDVNILRWECLRRNKYYQDEVEKIIKDWRNRIDESQKIKRYIQAYEEFPKLFENKRQLLIKNQSGKITEDAYREGIEEYKKRLESIYSVFRYEYPLDPDLTGFREKWGLLFPIDPSVSTECGYTHPPGRSYYVLEVIHTDMEELIFFSHRIGRVVEPVLGELKNIEGENRYLWTREIKIEKEIEHEIKEGETLSNIPYDEELILKINLNNKRELIMEEIDKCLSDFYKKRRFHFKKVWRYLKIYDLRDKKNDYESIAKIVYPDLNLEDDKEVKRSIDNVKKGFAAAYKLIYGKEHKPLLKKEIKPEDLPRTCARCEKWSTCTELCPKISAYVDQDTKYQRERPYEEKLDYLAFSE